VTEPKHDPKHDPKPDAAKTAADLKAAAAKRDQEQAEEQRQRDQKRHEDEKKADAARADASTAAKAGVKSGLYELKRDGAALNITTHGTLVATLRGDYASRVEEKFIRLQHEDAEAMAREDDDVREERENEVFLSRADQFMATMIAQLGEEQKGPTPK
jgi:hypothetical protein